MLTAFSLPANFVEDGPTSCDFASLLQPDSPSSRPHTVETTSKDLSVGCASSPVLRRVTGGASPWRSSSDTERLACITAETSTTSNSLYEVGSAWVQGHRSSMEDTHTVELTLDAQSALLGVFDGHGGAECAQYCQRHAADVLRSTPGWAAGNVVRALKEAFLQLDQLMATACPSSSGTTCTMAVLQGHRLAVAGVGDSKCVLFHNKAGLSMEGVPHSSSLSSHSSASHRASGGGGSGSGGTSDVSTSGDSASLSSSCASGSRGHEPHRLAVPARQHRALSMTVDHKPDMPEEEERIRCAGGFVHQGRINCCLNVSRALGDAQFKQDAFRPASEQQVSPEPDIREAVINTTSDFLLLASDGIWNSMKEKVVLRFVKQRLQRGHAPADVCRDLCKVCLEPCRTAYDNCTAILVTFKAPSVYHPHGTPRHEPSLEGAPNPYHQNSPRHHFHRHQHQHYSHPQPQQQPAEQPVPRMSDGSAEESPSLSPMGASSPARGSPSPPLDTDMPGGNLAEPNPIARGGAQPGPTAPSRALQAWSGTDGTAHA